MSLGLLGGYGSDLDISDSDEELNRPPTVDQEFKSCGSPTNSEMAEHSNPKTKFNTRIDEHAGPCDNTVSSDPLDFTKDTESDQDSSTSSDSNSSPSSPSRTDISLHTPPQYTASLPLPDLDSVMVAGRNFLTGVSKEHQFDKTNSVFYNPYKEAEDAKLAILKKHVQDLADTKPPVKERKKRRRNVTEICSYDPNRCSTGRHSESGTP